MLFSFNKKKFQHPGLNNINEEKEEGTQNAN